MVHYIFSDSIEETFRRTDNYGKLSVLISEIVPKYLRKLFIKSWDKEHKGYPWKSNMESGGKLINEIPEKEKKKKKPFWQHKSKLEAGNEETWDTTILSYVMCNSGIKLCEKKLVKNNIQKLERVRSRFTTSASDMSHSFTDKDSEAMLKEIKDAASNIFGKDAEDEISYIYYLECRQHVAPEQFKQLNDEEKFTSRSDQSSLGSNDIRLGTLKL